jgi:hypothetical protein
MHLPSQVRLDSQPPETVSEMMFVAQTVALFHVTNSPTALDLVDHVRSTDLVFSLPEPHT